MTDPTLPTYGAVRRSWIRSRERDYRAETNSYPTAEQRAAWAAEFDAWADAIHAAAWDAAMRTRAAWEQDQRYYVEDEPTNPYRKD